jgi:hypothetical protein
MLRSPTWLRKSIHYPLPISAGAFARNRGGPVKIINLFSILPAVTNGWQFALYIVAVVVVLWMQRPPRR